jgi:uncharacterized membrane protein
VEQAAYVPVSVTLPLEQYIAEQNRRLQRMADLLARVQRRHYRQVSAATTLTDNDDILQVDTSGGSVTLPSASVLPGRSTVKRSQQ